MDCLWATLVARLLASSLRLLPTYLCVSDLACLLAGGAPKIPGGAPETAWLVARSLACKLAS